ncbi:putative NRPS-like protein biosynthetic cluster [Aspergillus brasiliensis]|nr:putative NRPS-like protein biosynthetic cluster [Aspergillus brasiliensis]
MNAPAWISSLSSGSSLDLVHGVRAATCAFITADVSLSSLPPIDTVIFSGITLYTADANEFKAKVRAIENLYGMTEGIFCATGAVKDLESISRDGFLAAGRPMAGSTRRLCAPNSTEPLPPGVAGEVHYSGYQKARGYIGIPSEPFYIDADECSWYKTGLAAKYISPSAIEVVLNRDSELNQLNPRAVPFPDAVAGEIPVIVVNREISWLQMQRIMHLILVQMGAAYVLATQALVQQTNANYQLTWDDVEDVFLANGFQYGMRHAHLIDYWEFFICTHTRHLFYNVASWTTVRSQLGKMCTT